MRKKILLIPLALLLIASLVACAAPAPEAAPTTPALTTEPAPTTAPTTPAPAPAPTTAPVEKPTYHWRASSSQPKSAPDAAALHAFAEDVLENSDGRIVIDVYDSGVLGDWVQAQEEVMKGTIEFSLSCLTGKWDPRLEMSLLPYLVSNYEEAEAAFGPHGPILEVLDECAKDSNLKFVSGYTTGFNGFGFTRLPENYGDPNADKNMKVRIAPIKMREIMCEAFGYTPVVIPWSDAGTAMLTGLADGIIGGTPMLCYENFREVLKYWITMNEVHQSYFFIMNRPLWDSLSEEDQKILAAAADKQGLLSFENGPELDASYLQKMTDFGIEVINLTPEQTAAYRQKTIEVIWPFLEERYGKLLMDEAVAFVESLK